MRKFVIDNGAGLLTVVVAKDIDEAARIHLENVYHNSKKVVREGEHEAVTYTEVKDSPFGNERIATEMHCYWHEYRFHIRSFVEQIDGTQLHPEVWQKERAQMVTLLRDISCELTSTPSRGFPETQKHQSLVQDIDSLLGGLAEVGNG